MAELTRPIATGIRAPLSRRTFLYRAALGSAVLAGLPPLVGTAAPPAREGRPRRFRLAGLGLAQPPPAFLGQPDAEWVAGSGPELSTAAYLRLIDASRPDAVVLDLSSPQFSPVAQAVIEQGLGVYCAGPFAASVRDGRTLAGLVERRGIVWQSGGWRRSRPAAGLACDAVRSGVLGAVRSIQIGVPGDMVLAARAEEELDLALWALDFAPLSEPFEVSPRADGGFAFAFSCGLRIELARTGVIEPGIAWIGERGWLRLARAGIWASSPSLAQAAGGAGPVRSPSGAEHERAFLDRLAGRKVPLAPASEAHQVHTLVELGLAAGSIGQTFTWNPRTESTRSAAVSALLERPVMLAA